MAKHTFHIGDTIFVTTTGMIEEVKIIDFTRDSGDFIVYSPYGEKKYTVTYNIDAFLTKERAIVRRKEVAAERKAKETIIGGGVCSICGLVWQSFSGRCDCKYSYR